MKDKRLKFCPMCGNPSPDIYNIGDWENCACWVVKCNECGVEVNDFFTQEDAIDAWNQRVENKAVSNMVNVADLVIEPLAPCPFCGKPPFTRLNVKNDNYGSTQVSLRVQCTDNNCGTFKTVNISNDISFDKLLDGIKKVVGLWNQRTKID